MSVEQEYIDIYRQFSTQIKQNAAEPTNAVRDAAFDCFAQQGFPTAALEGYQHSNLQERYAVNYGINLSQFNIAFNPYESFRCDVQSIKSHLLFVVNDVFCDGTQQARLVLDNLSRQGVIAGSLRKVGAQHPELLKRFYAKAADFNSDATVAFNTAFAMDGLFLYVPKGVKLDAPVQLINVMNGDADSMATSRNLVIIDEGARAQLLVCGHAAKSCKYLCNRVTEVFVGKNANYEQYKLEDTTADTTNIGSLFVQQDEASDVLINEITLHNGFTRNNVNVDLLGEHASLNLCGMAIGDKQEHIDNHTFINHAVPHCHSTELYKYVLNDAAVGSFDGKILVRPGAQKTEAYQSNKNIVVTQSAKMYTKPHLEIYADDVKCSHGAAVGQLDEEAIFYMRSRGISLTEARMLLMLAFANDVVENIKIEALRTRMHLLIEKRFRGENYKCNSCDSCK